MGVLAHEVVLEGRSRNQDQALLFSVFSSLFLSRHIFRSVRLLIYLEMATANEDDTQ